MEEGREGKVRFGVNAFVIGEPHFHSCTSLIDGRPVRDTEEEALQVWREIVGKADKEAVEGFRKEVQQAGQSTKEGKGMWADSSVEGHSHLLLRDTFTILMACHSRPRAVQ